MTEGACVCQDKSCQTNMIVFYSNVAGFLNKERAGIPITSALARLPETSPTRFQCSCLDNTAKQVGNYMGEKLDRQANQKKHKYSLQQKLEGKIVDFSPGFPFFFLLKLCLKQCPSEERLGSWTSTAWNCRFGENVTSGRRTPMWRS